MVNKIRKNGFDNIISIGRGNSSSASGTPIEKPSPFDSNPVKELDFITGRTQGKPSEEEMLRRLQDAFEPFASDARKHLPDSLKKIEQSVRKQMILEGYSGAFANEAGDATVGALLDQLPKK